MIKALFETNVFKKTIMIISSSLVLCLVYLMIDYSNFFNDSNGVLSSIYNRENKDMGLFFTLCMPVIGLMAFCFMILIPITIKESSQKLLLIGITAIILLIMYTSAVKTIESDAYILSKKESFLNNISKFYSQYSETDGTKEMVSYLNKNDYNSIGKMDIRNLKYTDILTMTTIVNQVNDPAIKKVYDESMRDGQISLLEKEKLDTLILKKINETI